MNNLFSNLQDTDDYEDIISNAVNGDYNSGFEIDTEELFNEGSALEQFPELKDGVTIGLENYLNRLIDLQEKIKKEGMSRGRSYELLELLPALEGYVKPEHFTEVPTMVGYEISNENANVKFWGILGAVVAFILGLIYKLLGGKKGKKKSDIEKIKDVTLTATLEMKSGIDIYRKLSDYKIQLDLTRNNDKSLIGSYQIPEQVKEAINSDRKELISTVGELAFRTDNRSASMGINNIYRPLAILYSNKADNFYTELDKVVKGVSENCHRAIKISESIGNTLPNLKVASADELLSELTSSLKANGIKEEELENDLSSLKESTENLDNLINEVQSFTIESDNLLDIMSEFVNVNNAYYKRDFNAYNKACEDMHNVYVSFKKIEGFINDLGSSPDMDVDKDMKQYLLKNIKTMVLIINQFQSLTDVIKKISTKLKDEYIRNLKNFSANFSFFVTSLEKYSDKETYDNYNEIRNDIIDLVRVHDLYFDGVT